MRKLVAVIAIAASTAAGSAFAAADANLNFTGLIRNPSCTVDSLSQDQTIDLNPVSISDFTGTTSTPTPFNINLKNCGDGTIVSMTVSGTSDSVASVLKSTGVATKVGVQLLKASSVGGTTGTAITLNSATSAGTVSGTSMTIPMVAQYYKLGTLTPGTVASSATVNFTYK
ncbi:type-1 fimbrial protein [Caballeronia peredens]|nr:type-1 fimbrial protein [Caballeronia peredens]